METTRKTTIFPFVPDMDPKENPNIPVISLYSLPCPGTQGGSLFSVLSLCFPLFSILACWTMSKPVYFSLQHPFRLPTWVIRGSDWMLGRQISSLLRLTGITAWNCSIFSDEGEPMVAMPLLVPLMRQTLHLAVSKGTWPGTPEQLVQSQNPGRIKMVCHSAPCAPIMLLFGLYLLGYTR